LIATVNKVFALNYFNTSVELINQSLNRLIMSLIVYCILVG